MTIALKLAGALALLAPPAASAAATPVDDPVRVTITARDVEASNQKVAAAYSALMTMWEREFERYGTPFRAPRIVRYRGNVQTSCGVMPQSNAVYCFNNNTIYFDEVFLAAQAKLTGLRTRTDGDMAAIGIIAHEVGHSVAFQLGRHSRSSYRNEATADCLAGAFARQAEADGQLEHGDLDEAFLAMASAGDPEFESTGDRRRDARNARVLARNAHGTEAQRQANFESGLRGGPLSCLEDFRPAA
ncbi:MAG TPA: neutral zinc metallopeptidase [Gemmatimonadaceae bacterium]|nr:neutral zinc metallopeptidase [Gemmatimonadaceae bacterium]